MNSRLLVEADIDPAPSALLMHHAPEHMPWQTRLKSAGFKALMGKGHAKFAITWQQDAEVFFEHLLTLLRQYNHWARGGAPCKHWSVSGCIDGPIRHHR